MTGKGGKTEGGNEVWSKKIGCAREQEAKDGNEDPKGMSQSLHQHP